MTNYYLPPVKRIVLGIGFIGLYLLYRPQPVLATLLAIVYLIVGLSWLEKDKS